MRERGETKRTLEKELKVLGVAGKGSEKNRMHTTMRFLGMAFWFPILFYPGRVRWEPAPNKLKDDEEKKTVHDGPMSSK